MYKLAEDKTIDQFLKRDNRYSEAASEDKRLVEVFRNDGNFHEIKLSDLKEGDAFSLFDRKTREPIADKYGHITYMASTDAYLAKHRTSGKIVYHVQIKDTPLGKEEENV